MRIDLELLLDVGDFADFAERPSVPPDIPGTKHPRPCHVCNAQFRRVASKHPRCKFLILTPPQLVLVVLLSGTHDVV